MVESDVNVLVKEERRPEAISTMIPSPISLQWWPTASMLTIIMCMRL
jgi:hypothetical protein